MTADSIRVLIADDHPMSRRGLKALLEDYPGITVVAECKTGVEAVSKFRECRPDVVVMDLRMPDLDGIGATAAILNISPDAKVLVLSSYDTQADLMRAKRAGARGYLLKESDPDEVVSAIQKIAAGGSYVPASLQERMTEAAGLSELNARDVRILHLMRDGLSNQQIATSLGLTEGTVRVYLTGLFGRMDVKNRTEAVAVAIASGMLPSADSPGR